MRIKLDPERNEALVSGRSEEEGDQESTLENVTMQGGAINIAFKESYLRDVLAAASGSNTIVMETNNSMSPGLFYEKGDESNLHVIMPLFVQWD